MPAKDAGSWGTFRHRWDVVKLNRRELAPGTWRGADAGTLTMASLIVTCGGCGVSSRVSRRGVARDRHCPRCGTPMDLDLTAPLSPPGSGDPGGTALEM